MGIFSQLFGNVGTGVQSNQSGNQQSTGLLNNLIPPSPDDIFKKVLVIIGIVCGFGVVIALIAAIAYVSKNKRKGGMS